MAILKNPTIPSIKTILNGCIMYLLKIIFYTIKAPVAKNKDTKSKIIPKICYAVVWI